MTFQAAEWGTVAAIVTAGVALAGFILHHLRQIRLNHLVHIDEKLEHILGLVTTNSERICHLHKKLDAHIQYHLEHDSK